MVFNKDERMKFWNDGVNSSFSFTLERIQILGTIWNRPCLYEVGQSR